MGTGMGMIPDPRPGQLLKSGVVVGVDPRPDPRQIGDGDGGGPPIPGKSGMGTGAHGDRRGVTVPCPGHCGSSLRVRLPTGPAG
jgi:hypothetical protein